MRSATQFKSLTSQARDMVFLLVTSTSNVLSPSKFFKLHLLNFSLTHIHLSSDILPQRLSWQHCGQYDAVFPKKEHQAVQIVPIRSSAGVVVAKVSIQSQPSLFSINKKSNFGPLRPSSPRCMNGNLQNTAGIIFGVTIVNVTYSPRRGYTPSKLILKILSGNKFCSWRV